MSTLGSGSLEHQNVLGVKMLEYLPYWVLDFQGAGIFREAMNIFSADLHTWATTQE